MRQCVPKDIHFLRRQGLVFFSAVCSLFKSPFKELAWYFHGISQRNKVCFTDKVSKQVLQAASSSRGPVQRFATIWSDCESTFFPPLPKWAPNQLKPRLYGCLSLTVKVKTPVFI